MIKVILSVSVDGVPHVEDVSKSLGENRTLIGVDLSVGVAPPKPREQMPMKATQFKEYGEPDVLRLVEVDEPHAGQVRSASRYARSASTPSTGRSAPDTCAR